MSVFFQPIYTQTVGATPVANIVFNNIPQGFQDLYFEINARTSFGSNAWDDVFVRFNGSTSGYSNTTMFIVGTSVVAGRTAAQDGGWCGWTTNSVSTASTFGLEGVYLPNYTEGNFKQYFFYGGAEGNTATLPMGMQAVSWRNTDPITSLTFYSANAANFLQGSTITVYGVSNTFDTAIPAAPTIGAVTDLAGKVSVAFTANDSGRADSYYAETTSGTLRTYGTGSPIVVPNVPKDSSLQYRAVAANSLGTGTSGNSSAITTYNDFASIATANGVTSNVMFTNIPQHYKHLQLRIIARNSTNVSDISVARVVFNNDNTSSYSYHLFYGNSSSALAEAGTNQSNGFAFVWFPGNSLLANAYSASVLDILDYSSATKFKTGKAHGGVDLNGSGRVAMFSGNWRSFAPISSITINFDYGTAASGTQIALYGIG